MRNNSSVENRVLQCCFCLFYVEVQKKKRKGRPSKRWSDLRRQSKSALVSPAVSPLLERCDGAGDALQIIKVMQSKFGQQYLEVLGAHSASSHCICKPLMREINSFRADPVVYQKPDVLQALDRCVVASGIPSRRQAQARGYVVSQKAWRRAVRVDQGDPDDAPKIGRPRKVDDKDMIALVEAELLKHSQETSDLIRVARADGGEEKLEFMRALTASKFAIHSGSVSLYLEMSFTTFLAVCKMHFPEYRMASRKTDYCDHCHFWHKSLVPQFWSFVSNTREKLAAVFKEYFKTFDDNRSVQEAAIGDIAAYARLLLQHIDRHADSCREARRAALDGLALQELHAIEAGFSHYLKGEIEILQSYQWHRRSKDRQKDVLSELRASLQVGQCIVWYDWMQYLTLPLAHTQTCDDYYGASRMEVSVFGCYVLQNFGGSRGRKEKYPIELMICLL